MESREEGSCGAWSVDHVDRTRDENKIGRRKETNCCHGARLDVGVVQTSLKEGESKRIEGGKERHPSCEWKTDTETKKKKDRKKKQPNEGDDRKERKK